MDATQVLDDFDEEELNNSGSKKTVAFLKVKAVGDFPETLFPVYEGENIIGRHDNCDITIPLQAVSKKHACIDVHGKNHLICDYNSRNKTRRNQMFLKPQAFYELVNETELSFADVTCQYIFAQSEDLIEKDNVYDSGSETASESMMPQSTEDDEEPDEDTKKAAAACSPKNEELEEPVEDQSTQDYSYKNPDLDESDHVFCAETDDDDETDDERDKKDESSPGIGGSSLNKDQTLPHSLGSEDPTTAATLPCNTLPCNTLPSTLEPDTIPETPFTQNRDFEPPYKLKRSVDVRVDTSRRISAGNTLAYGLSTLESPNSTRESMDVSESEKEELFSESTPEVKSKLLFNNTPDQTPAHNNDKGLPDAKQDEVMDDFLATQLYEPMEIPESPEFLQPEDSAEIKDKGPSANKTPEDKSPQYESSRATITEGETSECEISKGKTFEGKISEGTVSESKTLGDKISEGITFEDKKSEDIILNDMMETQAYGLDTLAQDEDMATQAYGLMVDADSADTGDELEATQVYVDDIEVPKMNDGFKLPGAMNTQELNENDRIGGKDETTVHNEEVENEDYDDEMDNQATQNYIENQVKKCGETSESSDNFLSLSSFMGLKSDSDSDFKTTRKSSSRKAKTKATSQEIIKESSTPVAVKRSSIVIEGENAISTEKRCYVECPGAEDETSREKGQNNRRTSTRKKSTRGGKKSIATRSKVQDEPSEDTMELPTTPAKDDLSTTRNDTITGEDAEEQLETSVGKRGKGKSTRGKKSTASRSKVQDEPSEDIMGLSTTPAKDDLSTTRNDTITGEDAEEQLETSVDKRGKGRSTRGKKSTATTRRGKKNETVADDNVEEAEVESLSGRRGKRKISEESSKNEVESGILKGGVENMETENKEEKLTMSGDEEDNDMFKLQISALDSSETDDFIPKKKTVVETKRSAQRGKKVKTDELAGNDESESINIEIEKIPESRAKRSVSRKSAKKVRGKKNQSLSKDDNDENTTESVCEQGEMIDKDEQTIANQKDLMVKSAKNKRSKKSQGVAKVDSHENLTEDVTKQDEIVENKKHTQGQQKESVEKSVVEQELPDVMTPVVNSRKSWSGRKGNQTSKSRSSASDDVVQNLEQVEETMNEPANNVDETKMKEPKTPVRGRARKRKSSENSTETVQQKKGTAKKSRKNTNTEESSETKNETHGRETTASLQDDIKFESPVLTPRSLSKRSSSTASTSSTSSVSRSARKGKKQEKEDSEDSVDHSSNVKIIFTGLQDNALAKAKKIVQTLGGKVVERLEDCTHLVTDKVRRTVKLLCAVSRGTPVVDMSWLDASKKSKSFVDSSNFILEDKEAQKKFNFSMERSLELAQNAGLLDGYKIHVTSHVRPPPADMKEIIKSAKGQIVSKMPTSRDDDVIVLSCDEDKMLCEKARVENVYTAELLLTGILRQQLDLDQNKLTLNTTSDVNSMPGKTKGRRKR